MPNIEYKRVNNKKFRSLLKGERRIIMGKASRKMNKNKKKKGQELQMGMVQELREELRTLFAEEKYSDVINKLA